MSEATFLSVTLVAALSAVLNPLAAVYIPAKLFDSNALINRAAAAAVATSELPVSCPAAVKAPAQFSFCRLLKIVTALPASFNEMVSVSMVPATSPPSGLFRIDETIANGSPVCAAFKIRAPAATSVNPAKPANEAKPPKRSPLSIEIAALAAIANGWTGDGITAAN